MRHTVGAAAGLEGWAVFLGRPVAVTVSPGEDGLWLATPEGRARVGSGWAGLERCSAIPLEPAGEVALTEHFLAAAHLAGLTDATISLDAPEFPLLDGAAREWFNLFAQAGLRPLDAPAETWTVERPLLVGADDAWVGWLPGAGLRVSVLYHHPDPRLPACWVSLDPTLPPDRDRLLSARTFLLPEEADALFAKGTIPAASRAAEGAAVVAGQMPWHDPDEPALHKALDLLGDMALAGRRPLGHLLSVRGGHRQNRLLLDAATALPGS